MDIQMASQGRTEANLEIKSELQKRQQLHDRFLKGYYTQRVLAAIASYASLYLKRGEYNTVKLLFEAQANGSSTGTGCVDISVVFCIRN
jgi:hypothetical protein